MIARFIGLAMLVLSPLAAQADTLITPDEYAPSKGRDLFRLCRAAILIELRDDEDKKTLLPRGAVEAMREQMTFLMADTIFSAPLLSMEDATKRMNFTERYMLEFGKTVGAELERLNEPNERARVLLGCQPFMWTIMKDRLEFLLQWRRKAMGLEGDFPALKVPKIEEFGKH